MATKTVRAAVLLFSCPMCNYLVLAPEQHYVVYRSSYMDPVTGEYISNSILDENCDYYLCPEGCGCSSQEGIREDYKLKEHIFPTKAILSISNLWGKRKKQDPDDYRYGIPLDDEELQTIFLQYFI